MALPGFAYEDLRDYCTDARHLLKIWEWLGFSNYTQVIDLCCGRGQLLQHFPESWSRIGVDRDFSVLQNNCDTSSGICFICADLGSPLPLHKIPLIHLGFSFLNTQNSTNIATIFLNIAQVLKSQGLLTVEALNIEHQRRLISGRSEIIRRVETLGGLPLESNVRVISSDTILLELRRLDGEIFLLPTTLYFHTTSFLNNIASTVDLHLIHMAAVHRFDSEFGPSHYWLIYRKA